MFSKHVSGEGTQARRIAIVGGGTAGHVYPALAVAAAYREIVPDVRITFLGTRLGLEGGLVPQAGYILELIPGSPLFGTDTAGKLRSLRNVFAGMAASARIFERDGTQALLSFGGYASAGPVLAARRAGIAIAMCEPNVAPGLTNRRLARFADRVFLGADQAAPAFAAGKTVVAGVPVRGSLLSSRPSRGATDAPRRLLVLGGSLGSSFLNQRAPRLIARLAADGLRLEVEHQTGPPQVENVRRLYTDLGLGATVSGFVGDIGPLYAWADFAISCAGAVTLAELALVGLPAFVVPLAAASEDHQAANAQAFFEATGCPWVRERNWDDAQVARQIGDLLRSETEMGELTQRLQGAARGDAALAIARSLEALITERR